jgi:hypothetical protein
MYTAHDVFTKLCPLWRYGYCERMLLLLLVACMLFWVKIGYF